MQMKNAMCSHENAEDNVAILRGDLNEKDCRRQSSHNDLESDAEDDVRETLHECEEHNDGVH